MHHIANNAGVTLQPEVKMDRAACLAKAYDECFPEETPVLGVTALEAGESPSGWSKILGVKLTTPDGSVGEGIFTQSEFIKFVQTGPAEFESDELLVSTLEDFKATVLSLKCDTQAGSLSAEEGLRGCDDEIALVRKRGPGLSPIQRRVAVVALKYQQPTPARTLSEGSPEHELEKVDFNTVYPVLQALVGAKLGTLENDGSNRYTWTAFPLKRTTAAPPQSPGVSIHEASESDLKAFKDLGAHKLDKFQKSQVLANQTKKPGQKEDGKEEYETPKPTKRRGCGGWGC